MFDLVEPNPAKHTSEVIDIFSKVKVGDLIGLCRLRLAILLAEALFSQLTSSEDAAVLTAAPDSESCDATGLKNAIGLPDHGFRVIY